MKRDEWEFPYSANSLNEAAVKKALYHSERQNWWSAKKSQVLDLIRSEGITIDESLAGTDVGKLSNYTRLPNVTIKEDLRRDLDECIQKEKEHRNKVEGYNAWMEVLSSQGSTMLPLNQDDWLYFFGK